VFSANRGIEYVIGQRSVAFLMMDSIKQFVRSLACLRHRECLEGLQELVAEIRLRQQVMENHPGVVIERETIILGYDRVRFSATKVRISRGTVLSFGDSVTGYGDIAVGENTWIGQFNNLRASGEAPIRIGRDCLISQYCTLVAANHQMRAGQTIRTQPQATDRRGVTLGDDVWLGAGVTILPGVSIGNGAVIGAGSVVTKNVPANEIWCGVPARTQGERTG